MRRGIASYKCSSRVTYLTLQIGLRSPSISLRLDVDNFDRVRRGPRSLLKTRNLARTRFGIPRAFPVWREECNDILEMSAFDLPNRSAAGDGGGHCSSPTAAREHQRYRT